MSQCLTFPDVVGELEGTSEVSAHLATCSGCQTICSVLQGLIEDPSADEIEILDRIEIDILNRQFRLSCPG